MMSSRTEVKGATRKWGGRIPEDFRRPSEERRLVWASKKKKGVGGQDFSRKLGPARKVVPAKVLARR